MKAFPIRGWNGYEEQINEGMDLRDYFAAKALQGLLSNPGFDANLAVSIVFSCYEVANKMMEVRTK